MEEEMAGGAMVEAAMAEVEVVVVKAVVAKVAVGLVGVMVEAMEEVATVAAGAEEAMEGAVAEAVKAEQEEAACTTPCPPRRAGSDRSEKRRGWGQTQPETSHPHTPSLGG